MYDSDSDNDMLGIIKTISLTEAGQPYSWVRLFPEGKRKHPKGTLNFNEDFHKTIVQGVNEQWRGIPPYVDTDHDNGISNGWLPEARYTPGRGTEVKVDWTPLGEERVQKKLYCFISPEFGPFTDPKTGKEYPLVLNAASLTNRPFLKDLGEVTLTRLNEMGAFEFADKPTKKDPEEKPGKPEENATKANPDPDDDGDDDSTKKGDTDKDYSGLDGNRKPKKAKMSESDENSTESLSAASTASATTRVYPPAEQHPSHNTSSTKETKMSEEIQGTAVTLTSGVDVAALTETAKQATAMLGEAHTAMVTMREANEQMRRELAESRLDIAFVALSESRKVELTADDGTVSAGMTKGFAAPVVTKAKTLILDNIALREPIMELLSLIQTTGMVPLSERGTSASGTDHDPFEPVSLADDADGSKKLAAAQAKAKSANLTWAALSADEKIGFLTLVEKN